MKTWNDYKEYVKYTDVASGRDLEDIEEQAKITDNAQSGNAVEANAPIRAKVDCDKIGLTTP